VRNSDGITKGRLRRPIGRCNGEFLNETDGELTAKALASVVLRVLIEAGCRMNEPGSKVPSPGVSKPLVFIVDDEPLLLELAVTLLEPFGFELKTFRDPASACRAFEAANPWPALVITDYAMHNMNGMELIQECKRLNPKQKIIMLSGTVDESICRDSPVKPDRFLAKPYQARQFTTLVQSVLAS
jgi:CheY-like chemotaxis protein